MNIKRFQGLALIFGAVFSLLAFFIPDPALARVLGILGFLLVIFGIPAVNTSQPSGSLGLIGVILIILSAAIALGFSLGVLGDTGMEDALITTSVISGLAGRIITGWVTIQKKVFSHWLGWALIGGRRSQPGRLFRSGFAWQHPFDLCHVAGNCCPGGLRCPNRSESLKKRKSLIARFVIPNEVRNLILVPLRSLVMHVILHTKCALRAGWLITRLSLRGAQRRGNLLLVLDEITLPKREVQFQARFLAGLGMTERNYVHAE